MSHETSLTEQEQQVEAFLGRFQPMDAAQSRDKIMFEAGRISAGHVHLWQGVSGVFAMLLLFSLLIRLTPSPPEPTIMVPQFASNQWPMPKEAPMQRSMDSQAYINVRQRVLRNGLDALPDTKGGRAVATDRMSYGDVLEKYMAL